MSESQTLIPKSPENIEIRLRAFGVRYLDPELTQFCLTLWERMQASPNLNTSRGKPGVWAASLVHVIARMNFLYDKSQPIHLKLETICDAFAASKKTVGAKATDIERKLGLGYVATGLCRTELMKAFIMLELTNGIVVTYLQAEKMGILPEGARPEDYCK